MLSTLLPMVSEVSLVHSRHVLSASFVTLSPITSCSRVLLESPKYSAVKLFTVPTRGVSSTSLVMPVQPAKGDSNILLPSPIVVTDAGILTLVIELQFLNARISIVVTAAGIVSEINDVQPESMPLFIILSVAGRANDVNEVQPEQK